MPHRNRTAETAKPGQPATRGHTIRRWARFYDAVSWLMSRGKGPAIRQQAIALAGVEAGQRVLDVGCGTGTLALALRAAVGADGEACGVDASPEMIEVARRKVAKATKTAKAEAKIDFQVGAIEALPFADDHFDRVLSTFMLHHLPKDVKRQGLMEIRRVLKPDGHLLVVDFGRQSHSFVGHVLANVFGHGAAHDTEALPQLLREAGFADAAALETAYRQLDFVRAG